ncbi:DUF2381 family protein [Myxococcus xanthus]|uniref:DUF2381 family protein n=1 Tax=Myxococcus xanthus TaxID=34 RepID=UPI0003600503|nr:DUF2381 family protein [Myxococcus xanthus]QVW70640.1 DUF2381 family protein [Myxococcus xanthus DZ2]QZZ49536.1 hypothetical protein MyxoNM_10005 [Myxococcus xanthus]UEO03233.1 DUF2381 family protein [Myxococcus xanthus DZ2]UYI23971.1 DUF2381 family protein [Myxococcus xanthus]SDY27776.1 Myxococcus xanthus paralogous family TIGR02268 [Myxococcus xanthus]
MPRTVSAVLFLFLLGGGLARAQPAFMSTGAGVRRIELSPESTSTAVEVSISSGLSSTILFDSELAREGVVLEGREQFSLVDIGQATIRLIPAEGISPGDRLRLVVRFRDEAAPGSATFLLVAHPANAEPVVEVYRRKRGVETYREEAREAKAEAQRCLEENERLRAERSAPQGLAGLLSMGKAGSGGVDDIDLGKSISRGPGVAVVVRLAYSYRSALRVAVDVTLAFPEGGQPWTATGAALRDKSGKELNVLQVWQVAPTPSEKSVRVIVEAEATPDSAQGPFTLKLWEANGPRTVTLGNVTFP